MMTAPGFWTEVFLAAKSLMDSGFKGSAHEAYCMARLKVEDRLNQIPLFSEEQRDQVPGPQQGQRSV